MTDISVTHENYKARIEELSALIEANDPSKDAEIERLARALEAYEDENFFVAPGEKPNPLP